MKKITLGVDIGGINSAFGVVDSDGEIYAEGGISTKAYPLFKDYSSYVEALASSMRSMLEALDFEWELVGIGIGAPNANYYEGTIEQPANLWKFSGEEQNPDEKLRVFRLCEDLNSYFPETSNVLMTNDANAATIGEMIYGNARGMRDFVMITLGTGLGSGFVANSQMIYGKDGFAGELGHMTIERGGRECGCGKLGCLECYVSATGIKRTAFELMATMRAKSTLRDVPFKDLDSAMLYHAAKKGDPIALEAFRFTGEKLGEALSTMAVVFSPEAFILFGGLAKAGELILEPTLKYMEENMMPAFRGKIKLLESGIQDRNVAVIGAAALIWQQQSI